MMSFSLTKHCAVTLLYIVVYIQRFMKWFILCAILIFTPSTINLEVFSSCAVACVAHTISFWAIIAVQNMANEEGGPNLPSRLQLRRGERTCGRARYAQQERERLANMQRLRRDRPERDDDGVFLVPADDAPGAVRALAENELAPVPPRVPLPEILFAASALVTQRRCPVDVVSSILAFAGLLLSFESETDERVDGRDDMHHEYVRLEIPVPLAAGLPPGVSVSHCVLLAVECTSKDQGWATFEPELNGTYRGSWTWVDVVVRKPVQACRDDAGRHSSSNAAAAAIETATDVSDENETEVARVRAFSNVRASRRFRHHLKCYEDPNGLVRNIELGDSVSLVLRSQYPGWSNTAKSGKVTAFFALEFDEVFSFVDLPLPASLTARRQEGDEDDSQRGYCSLQ